MDRVVIIQCHTIPEVDENSWSAGNTRLDMYKT